MTDDAFEDREPRLDMTLPAEGWVYVRVNDDSMTAFEIHEGERLEVYVESDKPQAAAERE